MGRDSGAENALLTAVDQGFEVGQGTLLDEGVQDAPICAIPADEKYSGHGR